MSHYIIKKWIEPYVLLETLKAHYKMQDLTFDGFSKNEVKEKFIKELNKKESFGLYMKNVNKFYLFTGEEPLNVEKLFGFNLDDYSLSEDYTEPLNMVDSGKAEAAIIIF